MDAFTDPAVRELWVMKSAQVGWTTLLENFIGYHIHQDPAPILLIQPTLDLAEAFSKDRLAPMVRDTPVLRGKVADVKSRDSGNTLLHKKFPGGHLTLAGANAASGLRARPIRIVLFDEVDTYPASAGTEGNPISLGKKRQTAFWNRRTAGGSTPTIKGASQIEEKFEISDQRYFFVPCPHCDEFQRLFWANVKWEDGKPETARYLCSHCGALWNDGDRLKAIARAEARSTKPFNGIAGFHLWEAYSPFVKMEEMVRNFLEAKKLPETLQTFINTSLGETWEDSGEKLEPVGLHARREAYTAASVPSGVLLITSGTDVQDDRLESFVYGWGADEEAWRIEHVVLRGDPGNQALWKEHDDVLRRRFRTDDGRELVIEACCVDSGGHFTEQVYRYCAARKRFRVWAIKGAGGQGRLAWPKKAGKGKAINVPVWLIGVDTIKALIYGRLKKVTEPGPGYVHFDSGADEEFFEQLTSEVVVTKQSMGRAVRVWRPKSLGVRQEGLDGTVYAYAAMLGRGGAALLAARSKVRPSVQASKTEVVAAAAEPEAAPAKPQDPFRQPQKQQKLPRRRGGFIHRYKW